MDIGLLVRTYVIEPDDRVKNWPFMSTLWPTIYITIIYLFIILSWGPRFMENRKPYLLTNIIRCYNIFQIIACSVIVYKLGTAGWFTGKLSLGCEPVGSPDDPSAMLITSLMWWNYLLKIAELFETLFFVLRKKYNQISNLHLYHHVSSVFIMWLGLKFVPGGMTSFPMLMNCLVHAIMYTYYLLSTLGPTWQKTLNKWKYKLTIVQMIQFSVVIIHISSGFSPSCDYPKIACILLIPNVLIVFYMFYNFYKKNYSRKIK